MPLINLMFDHNSLSPASSAPWQLLAADGQTWTALEFDLPESPVGWAAYGIGLAVVLSLTVLFYIKDTRELSRLWRFGLTGLRLVALALLVIVAINPQQRTQKMSYRPSRTAVLVDTSLSMRYPAESVPADESPSGREPPSRAETIRELFSRSPLLERLREQHQISLYTFDSKLVGAHHVLPAENAPGADGTTAGTGQASGPDIDWEEFLQPRGTETRLGEALLELIRQVGGRTLSGILVLTDGASNSGIDPGTAQEAARQGQTRLVTVGVGSTEQPVNLQVANLQAPTDVHLGDAYELSAFVQGQGLTGRPIQVELLMKPTGDEDAEPTVVEQKQVTLREDGIPVEVTFERTPSDAGEIEYAVRAAPISAVRELDRADNERRKTVNIIDRELQVLLVAGGPMREYRFVRNMLHRHPAMVADVWLQTVDPASAGMVSQEARTLLVRFPESLTELVEYDVIIAFDPDWSRISDEGIQNLAEWVDRHAGGLIMVAGDVYTPDLASTGNGLEPIRELCPVFLNPSLIDVMFGDSVEQTRQWDLTEEGRNAGFLQLTERPSASAEVWKDFPGVYRFYPTAGVKAGATVYAHVSDLQEQTEYGKPVLLASQFYGSGRTMYLGSPEMWRLRAFAEDYYDRFWTKMIREVAQGRLQRGSSRGLVLLERNEYVVGQTVRVRAQLLDPQLEPLQAESVPTEIFTPDGRPLIPSVELQSDRDRSGQFVGTFRAGQPGTYRIEVPIPESRDRLTASVNVVLPSLESEETRLNAQLLTDLVRDTGGDYLPLSELRQILEGENVQDQLNQLLPHRGEQVLVDERLQTLWDRQWVMFLLVGLLSLEWLTRKLLKLA